VVSAQSYKVRIKVIGRQQGLADRQINTLFQDTSGFIWLIGNSKIYRYDGYYMADLTNYVKNQSPIDYFIMSRQRIRDNCVYLDIPYGIIKFDLGDFKAHTVYSSRTNKLQEKIIDSFWDSQDRFWILLANGTMFVTDKNGTLLKKIKFKGYDEISPYTSIVINDIEKSVALVYRNTSVKIFDFKGNFIKRFELPGKKIVKEFKEPKNLNLNSSINNLSVWYSRDTVVSYELHSDSLWAVKLHDTRISNKEEVYHISADVRLEHNEDYLLKDLKGNILLNVSDEIRKVLKNEFSVYSVIMTSNNVLWVSVGYCIVQISFDPQLFTNFLDQNITSENLVGNSMRGMFEDTSNNVWVVSYELINKKGLTLHKINPETKAVLSYNPWKKKDFGVLYYRIREDTENKVLLLTEFGNIVSLDLGDFNNLHQVYSFGDNGVILTAFDLYKASNKDILVASAEGIFLLEKRKNKYTSSLLNELAWNSYNTIKPSKDGNIFVCGDKGLFLIDGDNYHIIKQYNNSANSEIKIPKLYIKDFIEDDHIIWAATSQGLLKLDLKRESYKLYQEQDGLYDEFLYSVKKGINHEVWMSSNRGIFKFNPVDESFRSFGFEFGLPALEFNNASDLKAHNGNLFFGSVNGVTMIDPRVVKSLREDDIKFNLEYCTYSKFNQNKIDTIYGFKIKSKLYLPPGSSNLSFTFYCSSYSNIDQNRFRYRLMDTRDTSWKLGTNKNVILFNYLPAGNFILEAQVAAAGSGWNRQIYRLAFEVEKYWYNTWLFYIGISLLIGFIVYMLYSWRLNQVKKIQSLRNKISSDIHDDIGSTLSSITLYSQTLLMAGPKDDQLPILEKIKRNAQLVQESLSDIIWSIRPSMDSMESIILRMRSYGVEYTEDAKISFELFCDEEIKELRLDMEARKNFYLIFKEAVNNAIKYSRTVKIYVSISMVGSYLVKMSIKDDGQGFDENNLIAGNGLVNMKRRALDMGGSLQVFSAPGKGTEVNLTFYSKI